MGKGSNTTKPPDYAKLYQQGINIDLKNLPKELQAELGYRQQYDPQYIQQALGLQHQYDPQLANEQLSALNRRDPQWLALHQSLGDKIQQALNQGYVDPRQNAAYNQWSQLAGKQAATAGQVDPTRAAAYGALGKQVTGDTLRGAQANPSQLRDMTQAIMARQPGLSYGEAQDMATAVYTGQRGTQLEQQRQQATNQFLGQQSTEQQQQASLAQGAQGLGQFYGANAPEMQAYGLAGTYIQPSNSVTGAINQIQGVTPPSANRYVNPNAGLQGAQFGLQNYQNLLAGNQLSGGGNPWTNALQGASTGASYGSIGGGYGAAGGAITGAVAGAFGYPQYSSILLKNNITRTGTETPDGIPIVEYDFDGKRWRGVIAEQVLKVRPDAVHTFPGGVLGVFYSRIGIELKEVAQ